MTVAFQSALTAANLNGNLISRTDAQDASGRINFINGVETDGEELSAIPASGTTGQVLAKASSANFDYEWVDVDVELPVGGTVGQALTKASSADFDVEWTSTSVSQLVQVVNYTTGAVATTTTAMVADDTIPQNTEGGEFMTLAITPTSASNKLKISVVITASHSASTAVIMALFQDSTADALACTVSNTYTGTAVVNLKIEHFMTAGTTSATTFKVRAGGVTGSTLTLNGASGARLFGGVSHSSITIEEFVG